jgi:SpoVK/Ycf46/Vps4 family AAA+-type ATPase
MYKIYITDACEYLGRGMDGSGGDGSSSGGLQTRILSTFLNELDGIVSLNLPGGEEGKVLVLAACNDIDTLDEALLRPGRLQHHVKLDLPSRLDVESILKLYSSSLRLSPSVVLSDLADKLFSSSSGRATGAQIKNICYRALMSRVRQNVLHCHMPSHGCAIHQGSAQKQAEHSSGGDGDHTSSDGSISLYIDEKNFVEAIEESFPKKETSGSEAATIAASQPSFDWQGAFTVGSASGFGSG